MSQIGSGPTMNDENQFLYSIISMVIKDNDLIKDNLIIFTVFPY